METRTEISAGGVVYRPNNGGGTEVALILTHEGRWQLPKGWIEVGEPPEAAAQREVREETGIEGDVIGPIDSVEYWFKSAYDPAPVRVHKFVHFYLLRHTGGSTANHDEEVQEARWVEIAEAESILTFKDERRIVAMARDALKGATEDIDA